MQALCFFIGILVNFSLFVDMTLQRTIGEYCHGFRDTNSLWRDGFHCPEFLDQKRAMICCGTCEMRYCCAILGARLDQGTCGSHEISQQSGSDSEQDTTNTAGLPVSVPFVILGSVFGAFLLLGSLVALVICLSHRQQAVFHTLDPASPQVGPGEPQQQQDTLPMTASTGASCGSFTSLCPPSTSQAGPTMPIQLHLTLQRPESPPHPQPSRASSSAQHPFRFPTFIHPSCIHPSLLYSYTAHMSDSCSLRSSCPPHSYPGPKQTHPPVII